MQITNVLGISILFVAIAVDSSAVREAPDHPGSLVTYLDDGGFIESNSFKSNYFFYKDVGGKTILKGKQKKRKWWCAWLCTRHVDKKAERIIITNTYFGDFEGVIVSAPGGTKTCNNSSECSLKEWAVGIGLKFRFDPIEPGRPGGASLSIDGVLTQHTVYVDDTVLRFMTAKGEHHF